MQKIFFYLNENDSLFQANDIDLPQLIAHRDQYDIYLIVPAQDVLLTEATLPPLNQHRLAQALPFALEDQLLDDVADLHFATAPPHPNEPVHTAVVTHKKMLHWLQILAEKNITPNILLPITLMLPLQEHAWHIIIREQTALVRTGLYSGFACDTENLSTLLLTYINEQPNIPSRLNIDYFGDQMVNLSAIPITMNERRFSAKQFLTECRNWQTAPPLNLLQNRYRTKSTLAKTFNAWRISAYLAASLLGLVLISHIISIIILHHEDKKLDTAIQVIYKKYFPNATSLIAPKQRLTDKLKELTQLSQRNPMLQWLDDAGLSLRQIPGMQLHQADFENGQLALRVSTNEPDAMDRFVDMLTTKNLEVKRENIVVEGTQTKGTILITEKTKS